MEIPDKRIEDATAGRAREGSGDTLDGMFSEICNQSSSLESADELWRRRPGWMLERYCDASFLGMFNQPVLRIRLHVSKTSLKYYYLSNNKRTVAQCIYILHILIKRRTVILLEFHIELLFQDIIL